MGNARLPRQGINYKPTSRINGEGRPKQNGGTKFIFRDRNSLNSINVWRVRKRRNYSFLTINHFTSFYSNFDTFFSTGKSKVHGCTGTEALYRQYGP
jgi:hypothetical protein